MRVQLYFFIVSFLYIDACENGFESFRNKSCVKIFNIKVNYTIAEAICKTYHNSQLAKFDNFDDEQHLKSLAFDVSAVEGNIWIKTDPNGMCASLSKTGETVLFECNHTHSFACMKKKEENNYEKLKKLENDLEVLAENVTKMFEENDKRIKNIMRIIHSGLSKMISSKEENSSLIDEITDVKKIDEKMVKRFFYISNKIDKCAGNEPFK
ncbi:hypothetical protein B4U79_16659 [Dinothrombium tinctorium]|uniref:C-type lectin domain-containing protein n=1 Tax=Dinothrombium tinctorium TaxID=1965070 RepID=A0A443QG34_9ACAR|nr:hypothetical protein B4U79_16659 [Dinothrombium tinctorium]